MESIKEFLISCGVSPRIDGEYYRIPATWRGGTNFSTVRVHSKTGDWIDWSGESGKLDSLIKLLTGQDTNNKDIQQLLERARENAAEPPAEKIKVKKYYPADITDRLLPYWKFYVEERQISPDIMRRHKVGLATTGKLRNFLTTGVTDRKGRIEGFFGRYHKDIPPPNVSKTKNIGKKTDWIFPAFLNDEFIRKDKEIILVEGLTDLYSFETIGVYKCICLFGVKISPVIINYICGIQCVKVVIATNNDTIGKEHGAGNAAALEIQKKLSKFINKEQIEIRLPEKFNDYNEQLRADREGFEKMWK